jgi:hypothetical protein
VVRVEARDVVRYPSVEFNDELGDALAYTYANHLADEKDDFKFIEAFGPAAIVSLISLLRDRYFPKIWPRLVNKASVS